MSYFKTSGITKKGVVELLILEQRRKENEEYITDLEVIIKEFQTEPSSRGLIATYQQKTTLFQ